MFLFFQYMFFLLFCTSIFGDELTVDPPRVWESTPLPAPLIPLQFSMENMVVDLIDPVYEDGVVYTEKGGVLSAPHLRMQAQKIVYTKKVDNPFSICTVYCEGNLIVDYQQWTLVGDSFYYDFNTHKGFLINGRTASPPWYVGGKEFLLLEEGNLVVIDGFITTSEGEVKDVVLHSSYICLTADQLISAKHVNICVNGLPIFWLPVIHLDLKNFERFPFAVKFGWGGFKGTYLSFLYRFLSWGDLNATARLDTFFGKGLGLGIESAYTPHWRPTRFFTRNYYAHDIALNDPKRKTRYRFQGTFFEKLHDVTIEGIYDFVSDAEMASDYTNQDFYLPTAGRTQIDFFYKNSCWIADLFARVRVNKFQTVNQELPSFQMRWHPYTLPNTGIILENAFKVSYLDYVFSEDIQAVPNFSSVRLSLCPFLYRPFLFGPVTLTPEAGFIGIAYSKSPQSGGALGDSIGKLGCKLESSFIRCEERWKHVIEPYLHYHYLTPPLVNPDAHYIFMIQDGWDRLNVLRFGIRNSFFQKFHSCIVRSLWFDLWANAFLKSKNSLHAIPKAYLNLEWMPFERLFIGSQSGWLFPQNQLDFYNIHADITINDFLALGVEYRYRSRFDWRKADFYNFILDSTRSQESLLDSPLSDESETFLFRIFARPHPSWAAKFDLRQGKHRKQKRAYLEYQLELTHILFQHWKLTFIYEKTQADQRYSFSLLMLPGAPL